MDIHQKLLEIARKEIGVKEVLGDKDSFRITEYKKTTPAVENTHDEVAWCSSFANWVVEQAGLKGTGNPMARSWLKWGKEIKIPVPGCIVILKRGTNPISGHVGFFVYRKSPGSWIDVLGGNQSDQVKISSFAEANVLGYRSAEGLTP